MKGLPLSELAYKPEKVMLLNRQAVLESVFPSEFGSQVTHLRSQLLAIRSQIGHSGLQEVSLLVVAVGKNASISSVLALGSVRL